MSKKLYTEDQMKELQRNPNVLKVSERSISYQPNFKLKAVLDYHKGKLPSQIFIEHGFNLELLGNRQPKRCLERWRET
ncbi:HTH domain-containing protein, partial [Bacillus swezeyi]